VVVPKRPVALVPVGVTITFFSKISREKDTALLLLAAVALVAVQLETVELVSDIATVQV
jgi:hypothetical protein